VKEAIIHEIPLFRDIQLIFYNSYLYPLVQILLISTDSLQLNKFCTIKTITMLRKVFTLLSVIALGFVYNAQAKIWRLNNNVAVNADFTTFYQAAGSASVLAGDTLYLEPSATAYTTNSFTLTKRLVVIGSGYFLDPTDVTYPFNPGLQVAGRTAQLGFLYLGAGSDGSKFMGISMEGSVYFSGSSNVKFEKVYFGYGGIYFQSGTNDNVSIRKCFYYGGSGFSSSTTVTITNLVIENNIFYGGYLTLDQLSGSGNIFRNNSIINSGSGFTISNTYVANNIFGTGGGVSNFVNCTIKNNLFQSNQTLPGTATNNQVNVNMANVYVGGTTGSLDSRAVLKAGSPAIGAGLTVGAVVTPDCGAYGATDPYKLSGIPNIPSIYAFTVPLSIPAGTTTMNVTFSTRNNQ